MTIAWFDGGAGASGDMMLGASGRSRGATHRAPGKPGLRSTSGSRLRVEDVQRGGLGATKVHVDVPETRTMRHLPEILGLFESLDPSVRQSASSGLPTIGRSRSLGAPDIDRRGPFPRSGALDSIADVVASCAGIQHLNLEAIYCSTLSLGNGNTRGAHGPIPVPVPAVLQIMKGVTAVQAGPAPFESTTPTGAALLAELVDVWGPMPPMTIDTIGMGAGTKDSTEVANVLRVVLGQPPLS